MSDATAATSAAEDLAKGPCPCGTGSTAEDCCLRYHRGAAKPPTAESLMRSRYSAYVLGDIQWLIDTHDPKSDEETDEEWTKKWSREATWLGLEVVETVAGGANDEVGEVEFIARYEMQNNPFAHHERARFRKQDGQWFYVDGDMIKQRPVVRDRPRVGRNDPCPCGSEKKYKKCCGAAA